MKRWPDAAGRFGRFGGRFVPETLIVGSAIVRIVEEHAASPSMVTDVGDFIASLKEPLRDPGATPTPS